MMPGGYLPPEHLSFTGGFSSVRFFKVIEITSDDEVVGCEFSL
jgi:hypothetical protein